MSEPSYRIKRYTYGEILKRLGEYGSGWQIEAERDYKDKKERMVYHIKAWGIIYPKNYEVVSYKLKAALEQFLADSEEFGLKL